MSGVLAWLELRGGAPTAPSRRALGAARELAAALGGDVHAVVAADGAEAAAASGWAEVVWHAALPADDALHRTRLLQAALEASGAEAVLLASGRASQAVAPRLALRAGGALLDEAVALWAEGGAVHAQRASYLQRVRETVVADAAPAVVTVEANAFREAEAGGPGEVRELPLDFREADARIRASERREAAGGRVPLEEAEVVVAGGRGVGSAEGFERYVLPLAERLGAGVAATRAAVDAGWRPFAEQVGQTGKTVSPRLYVALGVSGAVQHVSGMNRSGVVVAVDRDPDAPIFAACDYGIVGTLAEVVPALQAALDAERD